MVAATALRVTNIVNVGGRETVVLVRVTSVFNAGKHETGVL